MNTRLLATFVVGAAIIAVYYGRRGEAAERFAPGTSPVASLRACQTVPPNLSKDTREWYSALCSATNVEERIQSIVHRPKLQAPEMTSLLPLFSELMSTDDCTVNEMRHCYVAEGAAELMATVGTAAVPYAIKALRSKKVVEVHAGLLCTRDLVRSLKREGKTSELFSACSNLLPYVTIQITNDLPDKTFWFWGRIPEDAKNTEQELQRFLTPESPKK